MGTIPNQFWDISETYFCLTFVDHFWDQIRPFGTKSDHIGPILELFLTNYWTKSQTTWVLDMLEIGHGMILGTRHAGD